MKKNADLLIVNAAEILTMNPVHKQEDGSDPEAAEVGMIRGGAVAICGERIADVGSEERICDSFESERVIDAEDSVVAPGLVDPHTHLVFAGSRHIEFGMRMRGATYHEILEAGGGIHSTVRATRAASLEELVSLALPRVKALQHYGVTTAEVKSGYGLDIDTELRMLLAIKRLSEIQPVKLVPTYLGAHVVPMEYRDRRDAYIELIIKEVIPKVAGRGLARACDVFLDEGAFTFDEASEILGAAAEVGLKPKVHAGQFTEKGGPELVARLGGLSADHLELISDDGIAAMAEAGVVANLLPGAAFSLRDNFPSGRRIADGGVVVAVATDDNPGTSRTENLPLMASMAVTRMGLTSSEAWKAITCNAAKAIGMEDSIGAIIPGLFADLVVFSIPDFRTLLYHFGMNHAAIVVANGKIVKEEKVYE